MFPHMSSREKFGYLGLGAALIIGVSYVGAQQLRRPNPIVVDTHPAPIESPKINSVEMPVVPREVVVHVVGAIKKPGVQHFSPDSRVQDAIEKAGGTLPDADLESINLAAKLEDGSQVYVPHKNASANSQAPAEAYNPEKSRGIYSAKPKTGPASPTHSGAKTPTTVINLNTASSEQLQSIPGIGPATAEKIMEYRTQHGGFATVDELTVVKGIGAKKLEKMRKWLTAK